MASTFKPGIQTFKCDGALTKGMVVKAGSDKNHVAKATSSTDKILGFAQSTTANAEELVEVALQGGAKALASGNVAFGDFLTADSSGAAITTTSSGDHVVAQAMDSAVAGDVFDSFIRNFHY